jgi:hypothetical protein
MSAVTLLIIDGCMFIEKYLVSVTSSVRINLHTNQEASNGEWACVPEWFQNALKHKGALLILLENMLTLAHM